MADEREELAQWCEEHASRLRPPVHQEGAASTGHLKATARKFERIAALLRANAGWRPPEGWKLVPVEPTTDMINAVKWVSSGYVRGHRYAADTYLTMLAASPAPPEGEGNG